MASRRNHDAFDVCVLVTPFPPVTVLQNLSCQTRQAEGEGQLSSVGHDPQQRCRPGSARTYSVLGYFASFFYKFKSTSQIQFARCCDTILVRWYVHRGCNTRLGRDEVLGMKYFEKNLQSNFSGGRKAGNLPACSIHMAP